MNETIQLLQDVARSARTGEEALGALMEKAESAGMQDELDGRGSSTAPPRGTPRAPWPPPGNGPSRWG